MSKSLPLCSTETASLSVPGHNVQLGKASLWSSALLASTVLFAANAQAGVLRAELRSDGGSSCQNLVTAASGKTEAILGVQMSALEAMQNAQRQVEKSNCQDAGAVPNGFVQVSSFAVNQELIKTPQKIPNKTELVEFSPLVTRLAFATHPILPQQKPQMVTPVLASIDIQSGPAITPLVSQELITRALAILSNTRSVQFPAPVTRLAFTKQPILPQQKPQIVTPLLASVGIQSGPIFNPLGTHDIERSLKTPFNGKPDIFGSLALKISRTPMDQKWNRSHNAKEANITRTALAQAGGIVGVTHTEHNIRAVNRWVNAHVRYVDDYKLYGKADYWASAGLTIKSGRGDCEDYAIAKMELLKASGIKSSDLFLVIAKDLVRRADHAFLVVHVGNEMLVLDSETDRILNAEDVRDYRPIMSFNSNGKWLHGYPTKPANTQMASLALGR